MKVRIYSVFDSKGAAFGGPLCFNADGSAIREFSDYVNGVIAPGNNWQKHPEDYTLHYIGDMDVDTGELIPSLSKALVTASALKAYSDTGSTEGLKLAN